MTELVTTAIQLGVTKDGEVLTLDSPTVDLAAHLADIRQHESYLKEAKNAVQAELLARQDKDGKWTTHLPGMKLVGKSPAPYVEYDGPALREALLMLADEDVVTIEAVDRAVEAVVTYEPRANGIKSLKKLGGRVAAVIDSCGHETSPRRYVRVERCL